MKLDEVLVQNYRTLENVKVTFSGYYTAISGQNNAGKTTLMSRPCKTSATRMNIGFAPVPLCA